MHLTIAFDGHFEHVRQGIHHRHPHAVQATGKLVVFIGEFAPRMEGTKNYFNAGLPQFRMSVHGHSTAVVTHTDGVDGRDRKSTRLNSSHVAISYAVFCLKKKTTKTPQG